MVSIVTKSQCRTSKATLTMSKLVTGLIRGLLLCLGLVYGLYASANDAVCSTASLVNPAIDGGIGGTGAPIEHKGIGGTGAPVAKGGFGGTGDATKVDALLPQVDGDIVVIGVITGFASICVDGVEVHYDNSTPIFDGGQQAKLADLAVGKSVMLKADRTGGRLVAKAVGMFHAVTGPIERVDFGRGQVQVLGQMVRLDAQSMLHTKELLPGTQVRVSGHRIDTGEVIATRVDRAATAQSANTLGVVTKMHVDGFSVNNTRVKVIEKQQVANIRPGMEVHVSGNAEKGILLARHIELQPTRNALASARELLAEGYAYSGMKGFASVAGTQITVRHDGQDDKLEQLKGKVVRIEAKRNDKGEWVSGIIEPREGAMFNQRLENRSHDEEADKESGKGGSRQDSDGRHGDSLDSGRDDGSGKHGGGRDESGHHGHIDSRQDRSSSSRMDSSRQSERSHGLSDRVDSKESGRRSSHGGKNK